MKSSSPKRKLLRLRCSVQSYDWGKVGEDSEVGKLFCLNSKIPTENKPYAELWMGTHGSGPSFIVDDDSGSEALLLKDWLWENPEAIGERVLQRWGKELPFLFKVLSIAKALSIQAHPDKELAQALHNSRPDMYKDSNHKPEMALALTEFEALCGFISAEELKGVLSSVPEILDLVGDEAALQLLNIEEGDGEETVKATLQSIFTKLMSADNVVVSEAVSKMKSRLEMEVKERKLTTKEHLVLRLEKQYPVDVGVISAFFLNYLKLQPGEALYLDANEPHAYIHGECIECMATSDNVVRAGLTPKYRDVQTLCSMLTYKRGLPEILSGIPLDPHTMRYSPPFDEFEVDRCIIPLGAQVVLPASLGPAILIVLSGKGLVELDAVTEDLVKGDVFFVSCESELRLTAHDELHMYRAEVNHRFFK
ncbi:hypothetical protein AMTRI_Chr13g118320 [Amborella trichopoda]